MAEEVNRVADGDVVLLRFFDIEKSLPASVSPGPLEGLAAPGVSALYGEGSPSIA